MEIDKIFSEKTTVEITVVKLNNQKLTKSIYNQLRWYQPFDNQINFSEVSIFGFVIMNGDYIGIGSTKNSLFRFSTNYLRAISMAKNLDLRFVLLDRDVNIEKIVGLNRIKENMLDEIGNFYSQQIPKQYTVREVVNEEGHQILIELAEKADKFLKTFFKRQILL